MSQTFYRKGFLALAVATALGVSSFVQAADIKIGVAGPMTGANASFGEQYMKGAQAAADEINAHGGVNGGKIILVPGDDACEPKQAVAVANKLADQDKVAGVVGHFCSSSTIPASEVYADAGVIAITPGSTNPQVTERGLPAMFRMCGRDDQQGVPTLLSGGWRFDIGTGFVQITYTKVFILVAAFAGMAALTYIIKYTKLGRMCRATQQDRKMASILGINTDRVISYVFIIGAAMAALAGVLITVNYGTFDFYAGFIIGIKAFTAAVLGGIGSLPGAMLGGLILGVAESQFSGLINSDYKDVFSFALLVLILIFRPQGLLGRPLVAKV
ncbi:ABC transporter substrate-binding protein [Pseudomonas silvicola]|nr:ABC transporter substrate-binding protein [Pseudomonas silvicola]